MSARILILEVDAEGDATRIIRSVASMAEATDDARAVEATVGALATLSMAELVAIHNAMMNPDSHVTRFADRKTGAERILPIWRAAEAIRDVPPQAKKSKVAKKAKAQGAGRPRKPLTGTIHLVPGKCEGKIWQEKSARFAAFQVIQSNDGLTVSDYVAKVGAPALGLLGKLVEVGVVEVKAS